MASHSVNLSVAVRSKMSRILGILLISIILVHNVDLSPAVNRARQFLPALPGYVPVYIRPGDTPLEDINPDLAEAFNSYAQKHARLSFGLAKIHVQIDDHISNVEHLDLEDQNTVSSTETIYGHIQKIPKA